MVCTPRCLSQPREGQRTSHFHIIPQSRAVALGWDFIDQTTWEGQCNIPNPFSPWTVSPPHLTNLNPPTTQKDGGQVTITGEFLYPGSVTAVLIGGQPINLGTNVDLMDNMTIKVTLGNLTLAAGPYPVQVNTQFNGQNRFSNTLPLELTN